MGPKKEKEKEEKNSVRLFMTRKMSSPAVVPVVSAGRRRSSDGPKESVRGRRTEEEEERAATEGCCRLLVNVCPASPLMLGAGGHLLRSAGPAGVSRRRIAVETRRRSQMEGRCDNEKHKGDVKRRKGALPYVSRLKTAGGNSGPGGGGGFQRDFKAKPLFHINFPTLETVPFDK